MSTAQEREARSAEPLDHRFEVAHTGIQREVRRLPVGQPGATAVKADELAIGGDVLQPTAAFRIVPFELEVIVRRGGHGDQDRPGARYRKRDLRAVTGGCQLDPLFHARQCSPRG